MAFDQRHQAEMKRRRSAAESRRFEELRPLMNDTKWSEVFSALTHGGFWFQLRLIDSESSTLMCPSDVPWLDSAPGWVDGWFRGGFYLRELLWVRCPSVVPGELVQSVASRHQDLSGLLRQLEVLGRVAVTVNELYLEIRGYNSLPNAA
jgi:hypothetical protein